MIKNDENLIPINYEQKLNGVSKLNSNGVHNNKDKIHVEICQRSTSQLKLEILKPIVMNFLKMLINMHENGNEYPLSTNGIFTKFDNDKTMNDEIESIIIPDFQIFFESNNLSNIECHVYQLSEMGPNIEELDENEECLPAANHWILPCREFSGIWESLEFDTDIKKQLMRYANTALLFSDRGVDSNIINWNKVILFHGPPGTGKTSLCKGLAQKLSIYLSNRYSYGQLVEINSHSLFSKWFSESGKLVSKMFDKIQQLVDDKNAFVIVLIDEVESLTAARKQSFKSAEPSDSIRVVNALLTQIDQIRRYPNVLILTTSNVTGAIDIAFIDRADIKQYIGPPSTAAIYRIFDSCLKELMRTKIIQPEISILNYNSIESIDSSKVINLNPVTKLCLKLKTICSKCNNFSGRTLRKIMFLSYSNYIHPKSSCDLDEFLDGLKIQVEKYRDEKEKLTEAKDMDNQKELI